MSAPAVVIAASNLMPSLRERSGRRGRAPHVRRHGADPGAADDPRAAPALIVLERLFAATPRGAALINRIKTDPQLGARRSPRDVAHRRLHARQCRAAADRRTAPSSRRRSTPAARESDAKRYEPMRRSARRDARASSTGTARAARRASASVRASRFSWMATRRTSSTCRRSARRCISATILRPNQQVRISVPNDDFVMRFRGAVAWAKFELPKPTEPPRYRAGVEFADADPAAHRRVTATSSSCSSAATLNRQNRAAQRLSPRA